MYIGSTATIKLLDNLSNKIFVLCSTEQGHPISSELFKCFIHHFSEDLNNSIGVDVPMLNSESVTHLLWVDDLVFLALNPRSLGAIHKGRPQNMTGFDPLVPLCPHILAFYRQN